MTRPVALAVIAALVIGCAAGGVQAGALPVPDDHATPGETRHGAAHAARGPIPAAVIREVARRYGITLTKADPLGIRDPSCGHPGRAGRCELDHRIPWGCGGASTADNLWYQDDGDWQRKDRLEHWAERQVRLGHLTVEACQQMFAAPNNWRARYRVVFGADP